MVLDIISGTKEKRKLSLRNFIPKQFQAHCKILFSFVTINKLKAWHADIIRQLPLAPPTRKS